MRHRASNQAVAVHLVLHRFRFDPDALEVVISGSETKETENAFVGGRNRWAYNTFTNWEFWWPNFPVLVYFKARLWSVSAGCQRFLLPCHMSCRGSCCMAASATYCTTASDMLH